MQLILTRHAIQQMHERGVTKEQVIIRTIKYGAKTQQTDGLLSVYTYIRVAYKIGDDKYIVKTVMIG